MMTLQAGRGFTGPGVDELTEALFAARPVLNESDRRLALAVYRRLALGQPVPDSSLAADTGRSAASVGERLRTWPGVFRNDSQELIGFWGLTIAEMPLHRYRVNGIDLATWDPLFITPVLGEEATVESVDALTGAPISLKVTADGAASGSHPGVVMSFLNPAGKFDSNVIEQFCHYVHFFTSDETGLRWCAEHPGTFLVKLADAVTLGRRYAARLLADQPASGGTSLAIEAGGDS
jgi:hypothetical protein